MSILKSTSNLEKNIDYYIAKNTAGDFPIISKFLGAYIKSLLMSDSVLDLLSDLDKTSGVSFADSSVTEEEEAINFVLRDFCSSIGVIYRNEYREAIIRSLVRKDFDFYTWFFNVYFNIPEYNIKLEAGALGSDARVYWSDTINYEFEPYSIATTDAHIAFNNFSGEYEEMYSRLYTDMIVRSNLSLVIKVPKVNEADFRRALAKYSDLLLLVLPARLFPLFRFV